MMDPLCAFCERPQSWHSSRPLSMTHDWHRFEPEPEPEPPMTVTVDLEGEPKLVGWEPKP